MIINIFIQLFILIEKCFQCHIIFFEVSYKKKYERKSQLEKITSHSCPPLYGMYLTKVIKEDFGFFALRQSDSISLAIYCVNKP